MFEKIKEDMARIKDRKRLVNISRLLFSSKAFEAVVFYRVSSYFYDNGFLILSVFTKNISIKKTGCEIGEGAKIKPGLKIGHLVGIVISSGCKIGKNVTIQGNVVLGTKNDKAPEYPTIGDDVYIGVGAKILGNITIGDNVVIGANSVVLKSVRDNSLVVGIPARNIKKY